MIQLTFTHKLKQTTAKVKFVPRKGEEVLMDGILYRVVDVRHDIDNEDIEVLLWIDGEN